MTGGRVWVMGVMGGGGGGARSQAVNRVSFFSFF